MDPIIWIFAVTHDHVINICKAKHYNLEVLVAWKVSPKNENVVIIYLHCKHLFLEVVNKTLLEYVWQENTIFRFSTSKFNIKCKKKKKGTKWGLLKMSKWWENFHF